VVLAILAVGSSAVAAPRASLPDIEDEVMCPICGTLLEFSESPQADRERALIRRLIAEGKTKGQIEDELVSQYGPDVLATPSGHGFDLTAWIVPALALAIGAAVILAVYRRTRRRARPPDAMPALDPEDSEALERDLSRYRL
jgi:cytochrome c-type biogenesis protein CcmH/NrfF